MPHLLKPWRRALGATALERMIGVCLFSFRVLKNEELMRILPRKRTGFGSTERERFEQPGGVVGL